jgi:hypothetical protein
MCRREGRNKQTIGKKEAKVALGFISHYDSVKLLITLALIM